MVVSWLVINCRDPVLQEHGLQGIPDVQGHSPCALRLSDEKLPYDTSGDQNQVTPLHSAPDNCGGFLI